MMVNIKQCLIIALEQHFRIALENTLLQMATDMAYSNAQMVVENPYSGLTANIAGRNTPSTTYAAGTTPAASFYSAMSVR
ncbi:MAG TPA: hypothetical protein VEA59_01710 [Patescibacteria group bacterium]|nr:hypothetical protein [Patescibacteria group bacterium]